MTKDDYFTSERAELDKRSEHVSPSGRWRLVVTPYSTAPGCWGYTRGEVFDTKTGERVSDVKRNYSSLWFAWIEDHPITGKDYLISGEDYQGWTLCNLTDKTQRSYRPEKADNGFGWCVVSVRVELNGTLLAAHGCFWGGPYEYRLYDFTQPDAKDFEQVGFCHLTKGLYLDDEQHTTLEVDSEGRVTRTNYVRRFKRTGEYERDVEFMLSKISAHPSWKAMFALYYPDDDEEEAAAWALTPYEREVYARVGAQYELLERWVSARWLQDNEKIIEKTRDEP